MVPSTPYEPLRFGRIAISPAERVVSVDGQPVAVGARAFDVLLALALHRERLVTRQELLDLVWPGLVVEEHNITTQISALRKLLGPHVIATVPGRGYRFVATVAATTIEEPATDTLAAPPRNNLRAPRTRFIGREDAVTEIERLLAQTRLLTLTGIGGSGKTRLALECARRSVAGGIDDVWFVDLAPLTSPERVAFACASVLGLADDTEASLRDRLAVHLADRQALIVLDNCEHVRSGAAALVDALLARVGSSTRILATSREPLAVMGEQLYPLRPLSLPATDALDDVRAADAVRLFVDRARLNLPDFDVDVNNAAAIAEICRRLDGIALAVELAAARVPLLSVIDIATRLHDRFRLLTRGISAVARQQTLAATMQWSYDLLALAEQRMLRLLSVFAGGCTLEAAAAIARTADEYEALGLLTTLYDKSLLLIDRGDDADGTSRPRYRMLETVRQYARERLDESGESDAARTRHAEYFLGVAESAEPHLKGPQQSRWMRVLCLERENLAVAMDRCADEQAAVDPSWGLRLAAASYWYWLFNEIELGCRLALAALRRDRCGALARHTGNVEWQAKAHNVIGGCLNQSGDEAGSLPHYEQPRDLAQAGGSAATLSAVLNNIASIDFRHDRLEAAEHGFRQALRLARGEGNVRSALIILNNLIRTTVAARKHVDAQGFALEAERLLRDVGEDALKLELLEVTAGLASNTGDHDVAARWWGFACQRLVDEGYSRPLEDQANLERLSAGSRQALGDEAFERAEVLGRALDTQTAMRELRTWLESRAPRRET